MNDATPPELNYLRSASPTARARSINWLLQNPETVPTRLLMSTLQAETVPQLRKSLLRVLEIRQRSSPVPPTSPTSVLSEIPSKATRPEGVDKDNLFGAGVDIAALLRHELAPAIGWVRLAASEEIQDYESSGTEEAVRKLQRRIDGLVTLVKTEGVLDVRRMRLLDLLNTSWPQVNTGPSLAESEISSIEIDTDERLFATLLSNVYQNAIDASLDATGRIEVRVAAACSVGSYWIRVENPFKGHQFTMSDVLESGNSSKPAHQGHGLGLISMAAARLGLLVSLEGASGMASFTLSGVRTDE